jgi:TorA maturation chaperone TorD
MTESEARAALARADTCRFIAACYYQPEPAFAEEKLFDSLLESAALVDVNLVPYARKLGEEFRTNGIDTLLLDYTRLFLGPTDILAQPYGSVWLEDAKIVMGESTLAVQELYRQGGFEIDDQFRELPDHIAVELEFLYLLIFRETEAQSEGNSAGLTALTDLKKRFLSQHLGRWVAPFTSAVLHSAGCEFYRQLAGLTKAFVDREIASTT